MASFFFLLPQLVTFFLFSTHSFLPEIADVVRRGVNCTDAEARWQSAIGVLKPQQLIRSQLIAWLLLIRSSRISSKAVTGLSLSHIRGRKSFSCYYTEIHDDTVSSSFLTSWITCEKSTCHHRVRKSHSSSTLFPALTIACVQSLLPHPVTRNHKLFGKLPHWLK